MTNARIDTYNAALAAAYAARDAMITDRDSRDTYQLTDFATLDDYIAATGTGMGDAEFDVKLAASHQAACAAADAAFGALTAADKDELGIF